MFWLLISLFATQTLAPHPIIFSMEGHRRRVQIPDYVTPGQPVDVVTENNKIWIEDRAPVIIRFKEYYDDKMYELDSIEEGLKDYQSAPLALLCFGCLMFIVVPIAFWGGVWLVMRLVWKVL